MCLSVVDFNFEKPLEVEGIGYKNILVDKIGSKYYALLYDGYYPVNKWVVARSKREVGFSDKVSYKLGFHIFLKKQDAIEYGRRKNVVKVRYKNVTAIGKQSQYSNYGKTVITRKMFIEYTPSKKK